MTEITQVRVVPPKGTNGDGHSVGIHREHVTRTSTPESPEKPQSLNTRPAAPTKPGRRPWAWAMQPSGRSSLWWSSESHPKARILINVGCLTARCNSRPTSLPTSIRSACWLSCASFAFPSYSCSRR